MPPESTYTEEVGQKIAEMVAVGTPAYIAAQAVGIHRDTFYNWLNRHPTFSELVKRAQAEAVNERVQIILDAARSGKNWTAAAWHLERQYPEEFGIKPADKPNITVTVEIRDCTHDTRAIAREAPVDVPLIECKALED